MKNQEKQKIVKEICLVLATSIGLIITMLIIVKSTLFSNLLELIPEKLQGLKIISLILLQNLCLLAPLIWFYTKNKNLQAKDFGFRKTKISKVIGYTIIGLLTFILISISINLIQYLTGIQIPGFGEQIDKISVFGKGTLNQILAIITLALFAPLTEELFFRGYIQEQLQKITTTKIAIPIQALIFGFAHLEINVIIPLSILGIIMGYIYHKTNSIYSTIFFHAINNSLAFLALSFIQ